MQASAILQAYLDETSAAVLEGDFARYAGRVTLPFLLTTARTTLMVESDSALRAGFESFRSYLGLQRVTDYVRLVSQVQFLEPALISGHYTTHLMAQSQRIVPPFPSHILLRRGEDEVWRATSIANPTKGAKWPVHDLAVDPDAGRGG